MPDYTTSVYTRLLDELGAGDFNFVTFEKFPGLIDSRTIILRHDVDRLPFNSLAFARIQAEMGIKGSYYFRVVPGSWDERIIIEIAKLGHEIGYHYEDLSLAAKRQEAGGRRLKEEDLVKIAIKSFEDNLEKLRKIVPVKTICMHGSPMSKWDSRLLWKYYDYHDFGIVGEPYFDIDFNEVMYLTDTGRRWDGDSFNIRDKEIGRRQKAEGEELQRPRNEQHKSRDSKLLDLQTSALRPPPFPRFHSTFDIIKAAAQGTLPDKIMMTFHPQRWTDKLVPWVKELVWQNTKNVIKYFFVRLKP